MIFKKRWRSHVTLRWWVRYWPMQCCGGGAVTREELHRAGDGVGIPTGWQISWGTHGSLARGYGPSALCFKHLQLSPH